MVSKKHGRSLCLPRAGLRLVSQNSKLVGRCTGNMRASGSSSIDLRIHGRVLPAGIHRGLIVLFHLSGD